MTAWVNYDDVLGQIRSAGILVDSIEVGTHKPKRCKVDGDREKRGWYWLADVELTGKDGQRAWYIVGSYGVWRGNDNGATKIELPKGDGKPALSDDERKAMAARHKENARRAAAMRQAEADRAAAEASRVWRAYVSTGRSDYLERKGVGAHGVRFDPNGHGTIIIPMQDAAGRVHGLQIIRGKNRGKKLEKQYFPAGLAKQGHYHLIGAVAPGGILLLAEGYATAASLHESTGLPVAVAFDAGNLLPVAQALAKAYKGVRIIVCADDDYATDGNPGCAAASAAALAVSGHWFRPMFHDAANQQARDRISECAPLPGAKGLSEAEQAAAKKRVASLLAEIGTDKHTDFNDLQQHPDGGQHLIRAQVEEAIKAAGWHVSRPRQRVQQNVGGGEGEVKYSMLTAEQVVDRFSPVWSSDDVYMFDHEARCLVSRKSVIGRMGRHGWDQVISDPGWQKKPEVAMEQVDFDPTESDPAVKYNLWRGWPEPGVKPGSCKAMLGLLEHLCSFEEEKSGEVYQWVLKWLAYPLQNRGAKMQTAILMHGGQGAGKNTFFEAMLEIYGHEYAVEFGPKQLENRFNAIFSKRLFAIGNEVVASRADLYHVKGHIKHMITERRWIVEAKNKDQRWERNCCNFVFLSNELNPSALDKGDRRHLVIWTPHMPAQPDRAQTPDDGQYSASVHRREQAMSRIHAARIERENGGAQALYQYLMELDLTGFDEGTPPPMTQAKQDLIDINLDSRERFWQGWLKEEIGGLPCSPVSSEDLYAAYKLWADRTGIGKAVAMHSFMAFVRKQPECKSAIQARYKTGYNDERKIVVIPIIDEVPPGKTRETWIGGHVAAFRDALKEWRNDQ